METILLKKHWSIPECWKLDVYREKTEFGYRVAEHVIKNMKREDIIEEVKKAGLRGRGGAGFPTGMKWSFVPKASKKPVYLINNADEGEPGTFKDRFIMELDPHMMIEGMIIAAWALNCHTAYIYIRGEFNLPVKRTDAALAEAYKAGYLGKNIFGTDFHLDMYTHPGAGAYICGEETGLISSLEGKRANPRLKPPFPAVQGLFDSPTVVNNTETLACLPYIMKHGAAGYRKFGTEKSAGTKLFTVSGHVMKPGVYELPLGFPLKDLIFDVCGGMRPGRTLKAVIPGGSSAKILTAEEALKATMDYENLASLNTMLGSGGVIVMDDSTDMVQALKVLSRFYAHESCGQCTPCREGTRWLDDIVGRILRGTARLEDLDKLEDVCYNMTGTTICALSEAAVWPVQSFILKFRKEFEDYIKKGPQPGMEHHAAH